MVMRRLYRYRHPILALIFVLGLYTLGGFVIAPIFIKRYGVPALSQALGRPVLLQEVQINPFTLAVRVLDFEIQEPDERSLIGFDELFIDFEAVSLFRRAYTFKEISLTLPYVSAHILPDKKLNLLGLIPPSPEPPADDQPAKRGLPPLRIDLIHIASGIVEFRDESKKKPVMIDVVPIEVVLRNFSTKPGSESAYAFTAEFGQGETVSWNGTFSLDPLESEGTVSLANLSLLTFWRSVQDRFAFDLRDGALDVDIRYRFDTRADPINFYIDDGKIGIRNLAVAEKGGKEPIIVVPSLKVHDVGFDLARKDLAIGTLSTGQGRIRAWREPDGTMNYVPLLAIRNMEEREDVAASGRGSSESVEPRSWSIIVKTVELDKYGITFEDRSLIPSATLALDDLRATAQAVHLPLVKPVDVKVHFALNKTGQVEASGLVGLNPLRADLRLDVSQVALGPFQPYANRFVRGDIESGELQLVGRARYAAPPADEPLMGYEGNVAIVDFELADPTTHKAVLSWGALTLTDMAASLDPTSVRIREIEWRKPSIHAVVEADGTVNVSRLLVGPGGTAGPSGRQPPVSRSTPRAKNPPMFIAVEKIKLVNMDAAFIDQSVEPPVVTGLDHLSGSLTGLSSKEIAKATLSLTGKVDQVAPMKMAGRINPLSENAYTDVKISFDNLDLTAASPYAGKYVGFPITKGKLFLDLTYRVAQKQLFGENKLVVDQLTFGPKTDSPDAMSLPVRLAVALLKDRNGKIQIDLPVRGNLNEPDFRYGKVVVNALVNLITKVAASPFAAIGNLVGAKGEELQYIAFEPGRTDLDERDRRKIQSLAAALQERPALRLEVLGRADPQVDGPALAKQKIEAAIMARVGRGRTKAASAVPSPDRRLELLNELYVQQLGRQPLKREETPTGKSVERVMSAAEVMEELVAKQRVDESELRELAQDRAGRIRAYLVGEDGRDSIPDPQAQSSDGRMPPSPEEAGVHPTSNEREKGDAGPPLLSEDRVFLLEVELGGGDGNRVRSELKLAGV